MTIDVELVLLVLIDVDVDETVVFVVVVTLVLVGVDVVAVAVPDHISDKLVLHGVLSYLGHIGSSTDYTTCMCIQRYRWWNQCSQTRHIAHRQTVEP